MGGGGGHKKPVLRGDCLKMGGRLGQFADLMVGWGAWQERGVVALDLLEEDYPNAYYEISQNHLTNVLIQPSIIASN